MPRPGVVLVLLWDRTTARDTACARPGYSGRCWASRAWSSRTSRSRSIRTVTRRSWWCLRVPTPGRRVGCAQCRRRCPGYDAGVGVRRWRTVDTGTIRTFLQSAAPRVRCPEHGVLVADVPWARPGARCTYLLEDTCAWLVKNMALSAV